MNLELATVIESLINTRWDNTRRPICSAISELLINNISSCNGVSCRNCICWAYTEAETYSNKIIQVFKTI